MTLGHVVKSNKIVKKKTELDPDNEVGYTDLKEYLKVIYPLIDDWQPSKRFDVKMNNGSIKKFRPPYSSPSMKLSIDLENMDMYYDPEFMIEHDEVISNFYKQYGFKLIEIPAFLQLTKEVVKAYFNRDIYAGYLFPEGHTALSRKRKNTPGFLTVLGLRRMSQVYDKLPNQLIREIETIPESEYRYENINGFFELFERLHLDDNKDFLIAKEKYRDNVIKALKG